MSIKKYSGGAWKDVDSVKKYENGAWREVNSVKIYKNNAWEEIYPDGVSIEVTYHIYDGDMVSVNGHIVSDHAASINFGRTYTGTSLLGSLITGIEVRVLQNGQSILFENFEAKMSLSTGQEEETYFRYDSGGASNTLYAEWDNANDCYYGEVATSIPAACRVIYVGEDGDDIVLSGKYSDFCLEFSSYSVKIKEVILRKV